MFDRGKRNVSGCGLTGFMSASGKCVSGATIIDSICNMRERGNGLGSGFAAYGIYPDLSRHFALHLMYDFEKAREDTEHLLERAFEIALAEPVPTRKLSSISNPPGFWRYFCLPKGFTAEDAENAEGKEKIGRDFKIKPKEEFSASSAHSAVRESPEDYVLRTVMQINSQIEGAFVVSSGKNMAVFKGVGFPDEIGEFFQLDKYEAYTWIGHARFPTNTPGWWGGAHPFTILDWSVVHNGEISSYGTNRRYIETFGYECTMQTDTEVMAYLFDLLIRRHSMPLELVPAAMCAGFWKNIDLMPPDKRRLYSAIRAAYAPALVNGPFAIILGFAGGIIGLSDRVKLRPLVAATAGDTLYIASEEAAIRQIEKQLDKVWRPKAGEIVYAQLEIETSGALSASS